MDEEMKFSVLMSVYYEESPKFFNQAIESIWINQSLKPSEIILVEDGKLTDGLYKEIDNWQTELGSILKRVPLETNQGLGKALNIGLKHCQYEYVARMDTDDICSEDRFFQQISFLQENPEVDILGGQIQEFNDTISDIKSYRKLPITHNEIKNFAKKRCPFNHPTVFYRKSKVLESGGYQNDFLYEDYTLWVRMIKNGARASNLSVVVLHMRANENMFARRGGLSYAMSELKAQHQFYKLGFLSLLEFLRNITFRIPIRLVPNWLRILIYKNILRSSN